MKKYIYIFCILFITILMSGCLPEREYLTIYGDNNELLIGQTIKLTHNYKGKRDVIWDSTNYNVATVENGVVTTHKEGSVTIILKVGNSLAKFNINVRIPNLYIKGDNTGRATYTSKYELYINEDVDRYEYVIDNIQWSVSDTSIATISDTGLVSFKSEGILVIYAKVFGQTYEKVVTVQGLRMPELFLTGPTQIYVGQREKLTVAIRNPDYLSIGQISFKIDNRDLVSFNGAYPYQEIVGYKEGTVTVRVYCSKYPEVYDELTIVIIDNRMLSISGVTDMYVGETNQLTLITNGSLLESDIIWESLDQDVATVDENGLVTGLKEGTVLIKAYYEDDPNISSTFGINVQAKDESNLEDEYLLKVNTIIEQMTLSQKVGQMFAVGFSGTSFSSTFNNVIKEYNFGNVIYMGNNVTSYNTLAQMSNDIQNAMISANTVPAFITIDQEGGRVARLTNGGTHFISNMGMGALSDSTLIYQEGYAMGQELRNYGINVNFAPVLDVNNNPDNPVIGNRSYGEDPILVSNCGVQMFKGLQASNVMGTAKHFPGHGNTNVDSHTGLPVINSSKEELYQIELAPFINAINQGIDAIMTTHIIFTAIDSDLPATLSEKVLTGLLRNELGYDGLIITDGMEMKALNSFGNTSSLAVQAIKAGVDILLYTDNVNPRSAHSAIMNAVSNGTISEERIEESVRRILLKKIKYDILDNYTALNEDITKLLNENEELNNSFACKSLTLMKGENVSISKDESILIISPECTYSLGSGLANNSLGCYASTYLKNNGYNCDYYTVSKNVTSTESTQVMNLISQYDRVVFAGTNVYTSSYSKTSSLVNNILNKKPNSIIIALDTPYDYLSYNNLNNYICIYSYQKATVIAVSKYLNGEFKAEGVSPIDFDK